MNAVGIVAEYNPFHLGHGWHIAQTRRLLGEDWPVLCVMSGNWVQRGECALTDKWTRAAMALSEGADLVLELPLPWAVSSAEGFARGAISLLEASGVVDTLSFGSECGAVDRLKGAAASLDSSACQRELHHLMGEGFSFPAARQEALRLSGGGQAELLSTPNNNLGIEYIRALNALKSKIRPMTVTRVGEGHDGKPGKETDSPILSASTIRSKVRQGKWDEAVKGLPLRAKEVLQRAEIADMKYIERAMLARLRQMDEGNFSALPDNGKEEGLPLRLIRGAKKAKSLEEFYQLAKTRRYTHARMRRLALWAFLGLTADDRSGDGAAYLRVLGMSEKGKNLLHEMKRSAKLPVLTKPAHIRELDCAAQRLFELECRGDDLFGLCFERIKPCGMNYTTGPVLFSPI